MRVCVHVRGGEKEKKGVKERVSVREREEDREKRRVSETSDDTHLDHIISHLHFKNNILKYAK